MGTLSSIASKWIWRVLILAALLVLQGMTPLQAQGTEAPLIILMDGDFWSYSEATATLTQLTRWGYNQMPVMSPDGTRFAYASIADIAIDTLKRVGDTPNIPPSNIWLWNLQTGQPQRLTTQPDGAKFGSGPTTDYFTRRSNPVWSPDGTMLAWIAWLDAPQPSTSLVIFDVSANRTRAEISLNMLVGGIPPLGPKWGKSGIALRLPLSGVAAEKLLIFDGSGSLRLNTQVKTDQAPIVDFTWLAQNNQEFLGVSYLNGSWLLINPSTGALVNVAGLPELTNAANGLSSYFLLGRPTPSGMQWIAVNNEQDTLLNFGGYEYQLAIAPSGQALAYTADAVYILRAGQTIRVPGTERVAGPRVSALAWSYGLWRARVRQRPQPTLPANTVQCPGTPPTRLTIGSVARVSLNPAQPNALNDSPGRPSLNPGIRRLGLVPSGGLFTILDGPVCADNLLWWKVNYNNLIGWTAEGEGSVYWIEPYIGPSGADCPKDMPPRLIAGNQGRVAPGTPNALRSQPSKNNQISAILGAIPGKGVFTVLNGPSCADGYSWWQVNYQGLTGWTPEGEKGVYWLEPLICGFQLPSRLRVGARGIVLPGLPNALRSQPSKRSLSALLGEIPSGATFAIISGPICADNLAWWQVNYAGLTGWTPEGEGETYWLDLSK